MKRLLALLVAAALLAAGCGGDEGSTPPPGIQCPDPVVVTSAEDVVDQLSSLVWQGLGAYTSGVLPITADLVVEGTISLDASALPVSNDCLGRSDCSPQAGFVLDSAVTGVVGEGDAHLVCGESFGTVLLTDTTVRLRPFLRDTHPCTFNYTPMVEILPACGTACADGYQMCPTDGVCYATGVEYCQSCEGGAKEACACQGPDGPQEEGASCSYWQSGDVQCNGTCRDGVCTTESCP